MLDKHAPHAGACPQNDDTVGPEVLGEREAEETGLVPNPIWKIIRRFAVPVRASASLAKKGHQRVIHLPVPIARPAGNTPAGILGGICAEPVRYAKPASLPV